MSVIQSYALPLSLVIGTGLRASLRTSDMGLMSYFGEESRSFKLLTLLCAVNRYLAQVGKLGRINFSPFIS